MSRAALEEIFAADRALREAEDRLLETDPTDTLVEAVAEAMSMDDPEEAEMRLTRLADLCAQVPGMAMIEALMDILDHEEPQVRVNAGEALLDVAYEYYGEVARAVEKRLEQGHRGPGMAELPFLIAEVGEGGTVKLLRRFLKHPDAEVVAAALEAAVDAHEPELVDALRALVDDERDVTIADFETETEATIGALASEAVEHFERMED